MKSLIETLNKFANGTLAPISYHKTSDYNLGVHDGQVELAKWVLEQLEAQNIEVTEEVVLDEENGGRQEPVVRLSKRPTLSFEFVVPFAQGFFAEVQVDEPDHSDDYCKPDELDWSDV